MWTHRWGQVRPTDGTNGSCEYNESNGIGSSFLWRDFGRYKSCLLDHATSRAKQKTRKDPQGLMERALRNPPSVTDK
jgi:hypothetical protein